MVYKITPKGWINELETFFNILTMEARIKGKELLEELKLMLTPHSLPDSVLRKRY